MLLTSLTRTGGKFKAQSTPADDSGVPRIWIQAHYSSFNGLRAVAVLLVFFHHFGKFILPEALVKYMWTGVDLFFVLSGFLITGILLDSLHDPRYFRNFYVRRSLRIFPVFYGFFLLLFALRPVLHITFSRSLFTYVCYVGNLTLPFLDIAHNNPTVVFFRLRGYTPSLNIGHLWSLCVEEQFYLVWPAVIYLVRSRIMLMKICLIASAVILGLRIVLQTTASATLLDLGLVKWTTFCRADTLLAGAFVALWLRGSAISRRSLRRLSSGLFLTPLLVLFFAATRLQQSDWEFFLMTAGYTFIAVAACGCLLAALDETGKVSRALRLPQLSSFGAISYGFYFIHHLFMREMDRVVLHVAFFRRFPWIIAVATFVLSVLLAKLSFRYLESPFLRLKQKLAPQWTPDEAPASERSPLMWPEPLHVPEPQPSL